MDVIHPRDTPRSILASIDDDIYKEVSLFIFEPVKSSAPAFQKKILISIAFLSLLLEILFFQIESL